MIITHNELRKSKKVIRKVLLMCNNNFENTKSLKNFKNLFPNTIVCIMHKIEKQRQVINLF